MLFEVTAFRYQGGHRLWVEFNNGRSGELEWKDAVGGPMSAPLQDPAYFAQVRLNPECGVLEWPNGFDLAPEYLYFLAFQNESALHDLFASWRYATDGHGW